MAESRTLTEDILLVRYLDLEFIDDVSDYQCGRCDRVVIKHYISNCGHHFCLNCKKILEDGGSINKWRCPVCQQLIDHVDRQRMSMTQKVNALRVRCPNNKYGCPVISSIGAMPEHLKECEDTLEAALPVIYKGTNTMQAILDQMTKMNKKIDTLNEGINVISDMVIQLDIVDNQNKKTVEIAVDELKNRINAVKMELEITNGIVKTDMQNITEIGNNAVPVDMETRLRALEDAMQKQANQVQSEQRPLPSSLEALKIELNGKIDLLAKMFDQKLAEAKMDKMMDIKEIVVKKKTQSQEGTFNKKLAVVKTKMENNIEETNSEMDKQMEKMTEQVATIETLSDLIDKKSENDIEQLDEKITTSNDTIATLDTEREQMELKMTSLEDELKVLRINTPVFKIAVKAAINEITTKLTDNVNKMKRISTEMMLMEEALDLQHLHLQPDIPSYDVHLFQSLVHSWTIKGIKEMMEQKEFEVESKVFPLKGYHFGARVKLQLTTVDTVDLYLCFVDHKDTKRPIEFKQFPLLTYILRDQSENEHKNDYVDTNDILYEAVLIDYENYYYRSIFSYKSLFSESLYVNDDSVVLDILFEPPSVTQLTHPNDGIMTWKVYNYQHSKLLEKNRIGYQCYPYFYTSPNGFKIKFRMFLNGLNDFKGKGLTAAIKFLSREFYAFNHETTVTIFNQRDTNKNIKISVDVDKRYYYFHIASHSEIENNGFLLNDCLIFKIEIKAD